MEIENIVASARITGASLMKNVAASYATVRASLPAERATKSTERFRTLDLCSEQVCVRSRRLHAPNVAERSGDGDGDLYVAAVL
jgi:hypothetical protein